MKYDLDGLLNQHNKTSEILCHHIESIKVQLQKSLSDSVTNLSEKSSVLPNIKGQEISEVNEDRAPCTYSEIVKQKEANKNEEWQMIVKHKVPDKRIPEKIKGTSKNLTLKSGVGRERHWDLYLSNLSTDVTKDALTQYLTQNSIGLQEVWLFTPAWAKERFVTAKIRVNFVDREKAKSNLLWPEGVWVRDWDYRPRDISVKQSRVPESKDLISDLNNES